MTSRHYLNINSVDRISTSNSPSDFQIQLPFGINCDSCELIELLMPNSYFNITNSNNAFIFNGVTQFVTPGLYNLNELFIQMTNQFEAITSVVYDDQMGVATITTSSSQQLSFPSKNSINFIFGFPQSYNQTGTTFISSNPPSLAQYPVYICVGELSSNYMTTTPFICNPTFTVINNVNKYDIVQWYKNSQYCQQVNVREAGAPIYTLNIQVRDQYGQILQALGEFSMILNFF
jgi:hypothetical protein